MPHLNYHHLRYFWAVAQDGNLTRAAERLRVSPSSLSIQVQMLEDSFGHKLFDREGRGLKLTEAGRIALDHATVIFRAGDELSSALAKGRVVSRKALKIGSVATLSRNFQLEFVRPLLGRADVELIVSSGSLQELLAQLRDHTIDIVLSNLPAPHAAETGWQSTLVQEQPVSLIGPPSKSRRRIDFPDGLRDVPILLPGARSNIRVTFDQLMSQAGFEPTIIAEVDDMAMLRLLAREGVGMAIVPPVVVQDELRAKILVERCRIPQLKESFYAITRARRFPNPLVTELLMVRPAPRTGRPST